MTITTPRTTVSFLPVDIPLADTRNIVWRKTESIAINKLWNGEAAPDERHAAARLMWSDNALYVRFDCRQKEPLYLNELPQVSTKTMQLWEHDVCELFLASDRTEPRRYAEFEISPQGEWLDLMVDWRKDEPRDWDYLSGMEPFARIEEDLVTMVFKVPWTAFDGRPEIGEVWLGNLFRQVGSGESRGYLAWSPTMTDEPQFHVPEKFGEFVFVK